MFMVDMRCSSRRSRRACPSISWDRKWEANSSQPEEEEKMEEVDERQSRGIHLQSNIIQHLHYTLINTTFKI